VFVASLFCCFFLLLPLCIRSHCVCIPLLCSSVVHPLPSSSHSTSSSVLLPQLFCKAFNELKKREMRKQPLLRRRHRFDGSRRWRRGSAHAMRCGVRSRSGLEVCPCLRVLHCLFVSVSAFLALCAVRQACHTPAMVSVEGLLVARNPLRRKPAHGPPSCGPLRVSPHTATTAAAEQRGRATHTHTHTDTQTGWQEQARTRNRGWTRRAKGETDQFTRGGLSPCRNLVARRLPAPRLRGTRTQLARQRTQTVLVLRPFLRVPLRPVPCFGRAWLASGSDGHRGAAAETHSPVQ
jgi:hypothetical protein